MAARSLLAALVFLASAIDIPLSAQITVFSEPGAGFTNANATGQSVFWLFRNQSSSTVTIWTSCSVVDRVTSCSVPPSYDIVSQGVVQVTVTFAVGNPGFGRVNLDAHTTDCPPDACLTYNGGSNRTVQSTAAPTSSSISIDPSPNNGDYLDVSKCVASCFDEMVGYTTPAYFSLDAPRAVSLVYRSSQAKPMGFVQIDATDNTNPAPDKMSILLKRTDGSWVTFTNGSTEIFDTSGSGTSRLAAQFDAAALSTGAYDYTVVARSRRSGAPQEATYPIRILVRNETASPAGVGWSIPGPQQLFVRSDAAVVIADGDGSLAFFKPSLCPSVCGFTSPPGDFTAVSSIGSYPNMSGYIRRYPDGTVVTFSAAGRVTAVRDRFGGLLASYGYDASNLLTAITDSAGKADSLKYDANNKLKAIKDPAGRIDSIAVDASGNLTRIKDVVGGLPFQGTYDANHRLIVRVDRRGGTWAVSYDFAGKLAADTGPQIMASGQTLRPIIRFSSIERGVLVDPGSGMGSSATPAPRVLGSSVRAQVTNPRRFTTNYTLDRLGSPIRVQDPIGNTRALARDANSHVIRDSFPTGHIIRYSWQTSNLTQIWDSASQRKVNYAYDGTYNLLTVMSGDVDSLISVLTADKKATDSTRVGGATVWQHYTHAPPFCVQSDQPTAHAQTCTYRATTGFRNTDSMITRGQPTTPRAKVAFQYDGHGQRTRMISAVGDTTWTQYDSLGRVKKVIGPSHDTTSYTYDSLYLTQVRDAKGQTYKFWPNALGWVDSTADPAGRTARFVYDTAGNLVTFVNRRGQSITFTYDSLNQTRFRIIGSDTTKFFADPQGHYLAVANRESIDTLRADSVGRPIAEISCRVLVSGAAPQCFRDSSIYEIRDLRTKLMVTAPGLWSTQAATYHYNGNMLLDTLTNFGGEKQAFTYGGELTDSTRTFVALSNLTISFGHPPWLQGTSDVTLSDPTYNSLLGVASSFDTLARVTKHYHGALGTPDTLRSSLYSAGRLVNAADTSYTWSSTACSLGALGDSCDYNKVQTKVSVGTPSRFYYDSVGNRKDSTAQAYGVDPGNRLRRLAYVRMDYDFDGNLTRRRILKASDTTRTVSTDSLFWGATGLLDSLHRVDSLGNQTLRISWGYDGLGRQVRQSMAASTTRFLWDGNNMTFKLDTLGRWIAFWTFYPETREPQSITTTDCSSGRCTPFQTFYYMTDDLHNTVALIRSNPFQLYNQYRYGAFGDSLAATGPTATAGNLLYKGAFYDGYTSYYRMGARYYDPAAGRFISEDPFGLSAGINLYTFGGNDPVNGYDPEGTCFIACWIIKVVIDLVIAAVLNDISSSPSSPIASPWLGGGPCDCMGRPCVAFNSGPGDCPTQGGAISTIAKVSILALGVLAVKKVYDWLFSGSTASPQPAPPLPSCASHTFFGPDGFIGVQTGPTGIVQWGAYMWDPARNYGDWWSESFVNGVSMNDVKKPPAQFYPPHSSIKPPRVKPGDIFSVDVRHVYVDELANTHEAMNVPNACIVP